MRLMGINNLNENAVSGDVVGLTSSALSGPCRLLQWASKFTRKLVRSSLGGEACASARRVAAWLFCAKSMHLFGTRRRAWSAWRAVKDFSLTSRTRGPLLESTAPATFRADATQLTTMNWIMSLGHRERLTLRPVSPRSKAKWYPYYESCNRAHSTPVRSARCGERRFKKMGASDTSSL